MMENMSAMIYIYGIMPKIYNNTKIHRWQGEDISSNACTFWGR